MMFVSEIIKKANNYNNFLMDKWLRDFYYQSLERQVGIPWMEGLCGAYFPEKEIPDNSGKKLKLSHKLKNWVLEKSANLEIIKF